MLKLTHQVGDLAVKPEKKNVYKDVDENATDDDTEDGSFEGKAEDYRDDVMEKMAEVIEKLTQLRSDALTQIPKETKITAKLTGQKSYNGMMGKLSSLSTKEAPILKKLKRINAICKALGKELPQFIDFFYECHAYEQLLQESLVEKEKKEHDSILQNLEKKKEHLH